MSRRENRKSHSRRSVCSVFFLAAFLFTPFASDSFGAEVLKPIFEAFFIPSAGDPLGIETPHLYSSIASCFSSHDRPDVPVYYSIDLTMKDGFLTKASSLDGYDLLWPIQKDPRGFKSVSLPFRGQTGDQKFSFHAVVCQENGVCTKEDLLFSSPIKSGRVFYSPACGRIENSVRRFPNGRHLGVEILETSLSDNLLRLWIRPQINVKLLQVIDETSGLVYHPLIASGVNDTFLLTVKLSPAADLDALVLFDRERGIRFQPNPSGDVSAFYRVSSTSQSSIPWYVWFLFGAVLVFIGIKILAVLSEKRQAKG